MSSQLSTSVLYLWCLGLNLHRGLKPHKSVCSSMWTMCRCSLCNAWRDTGQQVCRQETASSPINWYGWPVGKSCNLCFCRIALDSEKSAVNAAVGSAKSRSICWTGAASWNAGEHFATSPVLRASSWAAAFTLAAIICSQIRRPALQNCWASTNSYS